MAASPVRVRIGPPGGDASAAGSGRGDADRSSAHRGSVDTSFGVDGRFVLSFDAGAVAVQNDGRVLVAGGNVVLRLTARGNTDDTFGTGGIVALSSANTFNDAASDIIVRSSGSITLL